MLQGGGSPTEKGRLFYISREKESSRQETVLLREKSRLVQSKKKKKNEERKKGNANLASKWMHLSKKGEIIHKERRGLRRREKRNALPPNKKFQKRSRPSILLKGGEARDRDARNSGNKGKGIGKKGVLCGQDIVAVLLEAIAAILNGRGGCRPERIQIRSYQKKGKIQRFAAKKNARRSRQEKESGPLLMYDLKKKKVSVWKKNHARERGKIARGKGARTSKKGGNTRSEEGDENGGTAICGGGNYLSQITSAASLGGRKESCRRCAQRREREEETKKPSTATKKKKKKLGAGREEGEGRGVHLL